MQLLHAIQARKAMALTQDKSELFCVFAVFSRALQGQCSILTDIVEVRQVIN